MIKTEWLQKLVTTNKPPLWVVGAAVGIGLGLLLPVGIKAFLGIVVLCAAGFVTCKRLFVADLK